MNGVEKLIQNPRLNQAYELMSLVSAMFANNRDAFSFLLGDLHKTNVLIVDDDLGMRQLLIDQLNNFGIKNIKYYSDSAEAFEVFQASKPDIVFCDIVVKPLDGEAFIKKIRSLKTSVNPFVPVIVVSGHTEYHRVIKVRDAGANEFVAKPICTQSLFLKIYEVIYKPRKFVKSNDYFGPDRRRQENKNYGDKDRRHTPPQYYDLLDQNAINQLMG